MWSHSQPLSISAHKCYMKAVSEGNGQLTGQSDMLAEFHAGFKILLGLMQVLNGEEDYVMEKCCMRTTMGRRGLLWGGATHCSH